MKSKPIRWMIVAGACVLAAGIGWYESRPVHLADNQPVTVQPQDPSSRSAVLQRGAPLPIAMPDAGKLSSSVRQVVDITLSNAERGAAFRALPASLSTDDLEALRAYVQKPNVQDATSFGRAFKNFVMDQLGEMGTPEYPTLMARMYQDKNQDPVLRDYALQHLIEYYQRLADASQGQLPRGDLKQATQILWEAVKETDSSIAGTALLGLNRLSDTQPGIDRQRLSTLAGQLAGDESIGAFTRTTAIQVCARMGVNDALPAILEEARSGSTPALQISAIGALGLLDATNAIPFLNEVINGELDHLKPAAQQALRQMALLEQQKIQKLQEKLDEERARELREEKARNKSATF